MRGPRTDTYAPQFPELHRKKRSHDKKNKRKK